MSAALAAGCGRQEVLSPAAQESGTQEVQETGTRDAQQAEIVIEAEAGTVEPGGAGAEAVEPDRTDVRTTAVEPDVTDGEAAASAGMGTETAEADFSFAQIADREFYFSSGAGAWYTVVHIHGDGTFDGHYEDADMGVRDDQYPNGTLYYSDFSGSFTAPEMIDDHTAAFRIASMEYPYGFGEEIRDGYHYIYSSAHGLDNAQELYLYLPGARTADLPEAYKNWVRYELGDSGELSFYGLYNVKAECGFSSYPVKRAPERIAAVVSGAEERAAEAEGRLSQAQSQADMNGISGELYEVWDDALNIIWGILKETLEEDAMKALTEEERGWITQKETAVQEAADEYAGGSLSPLAANQKAADLTRERVYELAERYGAAE